MENMNGSVLDDEQIKENLKCRKNIEYESETLISNEASVELSEPLEEPQTADHLEGASARLVDNEASINVSKPDEKHVSSKVPGVIVEKEVVTCHKIKFPTLFCLSYCTCSILTRWIFLLQFFLFSCKFRTKELS
jgi:hypothetical protein